MKQSTTSTNAIVVKNLQKSYKDLKVLRGVNFTVKRGTILALLGPNGAGKTTTIKILSTLLNPNGEQASVNGYDVRTQAGKVRASIGLTGQYAAVDEYLTGKENLQLIGRLYPAVLKRSFVLAKDIVAELDKNPRAKKNFAACSATYKRIRVAYVEGARQRPEEFQKRLKSLIVAAEQNR